MRRLINFALVAIVAAGEVPPCALNGDWDDSTKSCICDKPWSGPDCSQFSFRPVKFPQGYGMSPNKTTWGGDIVTALGKYHLFATAMNGGRSLRSWATHSQIEHAVADDISGPYRFQDVAVPVFAHNPKVIELEDGTLALFHIGDGNPRLNRKSMGMQGRNLEAESSKGSTIHIAKSVEGPWIPLQDNSLGRCNNPAPFRVHVNGTSTIYIVCNHSTLMQAKSIAGPWTTVSYITPSETDPNSPIHYEDPYLYIDKRGFHVIYHAYNTAENPPHGHDCTQSTVSGHVFSKDGMTWFKSPGQPYGTHVALENGTTIVISTLERPTIIWGGKDKMGNPQMTHLLNGVCSAPNCPDGPPQGCVNCKYDNWDYTLIQPFAAI